MTIAIIIPARYTSTRFPGKPLAMIGGQSMLGRVVDLARTAASGLTDVNIAVATDDDRIAAHAREIGADAIMTPADCRTGSDRVLAAARLMKPFPDFIINLQGDAPFTPPDVVRAVIDAWRDNPSLPVITPVTALRWGELDSLRENKKTTPFSGTTCVTDHRGRALWFSKNIIPAIRKEERDNPLSPVLQHIGLYGFRADVLAHFVTLPEGRYERLEGLEQLRLIENDVPVQTVTVTTEIGMAQAGIDSPEDLARAEALLKTGAAQ